MTLLYIVLVILVGSAMALQGTVNSQLRAQWDVTTATLLNATVSLVLSLAIWAAAGAPLPPREKMTGLSPWLFAGGIFGTFIVFVSAIAYTRLSVAMALGLILVGQFMTALFIDATGFLGMPKVAITPERIFGFLLVVAGAVLLRRH